ncbi:MAG: class I SAM-dependent methyltransferase [Caulobacteraceae bacterium]
MSEKFEVLKGKLDNEQRRKALPPFKILDDIGLKEGDVMADIGCGIGYFTFPASEIVGESGKVYAMDIFPEMLEEVARKAEEKNSSNVVIVETSEDGLKIPEGSVNLAFISLVLHEIENKDKYLVEVDRVLSDSGRVAVIEWQKMESDFGPVLERRLDQEYVTDLLKGAGFKNITIKNIDADYYLITGEK